MKWWQLSLLGIGCTIGTGFFLGSGIAIQKSGPAVLIPFILAAIGTYIVYSKLAKMSVEDADAGSFRSYAKKAFGKWAGFSNGWIYALSEMLITGSQLMALGLFTQFWFPTISLWILVAIYAGLGLAVILTGMQGFEKFQNIFGAVKAAALLMFIIVAVVIIVKAMTGNGGGTELVEHNRPFFSEGVSGIWHGLLYAFYAFGGIEVMGFLVVDLKDKQSAPKAGRVMLIVLTGMYVASIAAVLALVSWQNVTADESPFITALNAYQIPLVDDLLNGVMIVAGFSTMVASMYATLTMLTSLAEDHDAPPVLAKKGNWKVPIPAFLFTSAAVIVSVVIALLLPDKIFEYVTTAAGLMLIFNWAFILVTFSKLMTPSRLEWVQIATGLLIIGAAVSGTITEGVSRIGLIISGGFLVIIAIATWLRYRKSDS
nr:amino acid permease [Lentibacillus saliphilus]